MKKRILFITLLILIPSVTFAASFQGNEKLLSITQPIADDFYGAGRTVTVMGGVEGDAFVAGEDVMIKGPITGDVMTVGGTVRIEGDVQDDVRVGGGQVSLEGLIGDDVMIGAGNVKIGQGTVIGGDLVVGAETLNLKGVVNGNVLGTGDKMVIDGVIKGNVRLFGVNHLDFGPNGMIEGKLTYSGSESAAQVPSDKVKGGVDFENLGASEKTGARSWYDRWVGPLLYSLLATLFSGLFFVWIFQPFTLGLTELFHAKTLKSLGLGIALLFLTPLASIVLMVSFVGLPLGLVLIGALLVTFYFGKLTACFGLGTWIFPLDKKASFTRHFGVFFVGATAFTLLGLIPVMGSISQFLFSLIGLGALVLYKVDLYHSMAKNK